MFKTAASAPVIAGRRDIDVVMFDDYERDTKEITDRAVAAASFQRDKIAALEETIWRLVMAAGGKIVVHRSHLMVDRKSMEMMQSNDHMTDSIVFEARIT